DVVRHGLDFRIRQFGGNGRHGGMVLTLAAAELDQLLFRVIRKLSGQARILGRDACAIGAVAGGASRYALGRDARAINGLALLDGGGILGVGGLFNRLLAEVGRNIADVFLGQRLGHDRHGRARTRGRLAFVTRFEIVQLLDQVFGVLLGQYRIDGDRAIAARSVTARTGNDAARLVTVGEQLLAFGKIRFWTRRGISGI